MKRGVERIALTLTFAAFATTARTQIGQSVSGQPGAGAEQIGTKRRREIGSSRTLRLLGYGFFAIQTST